MKVITAIIAKEFSGYFKNYTAYIILGVYLLLSFAAVFYSAYFFEYNNRGLISFFLYQPEILNILLPALTMKMWAEEQRQGTIEFLLTQPVNRSSLVWGKFLAAFIFSVCLLLMVFPFVLYSSHLVQLDWLNLIAAFSGVILIAAALCGLGCLISSFSNNAVIAYLSTVFIGWIWLMVNFDIILRPLKNLFPLMWHRLSGLLNFSEKYQEMIQGQISLETVIYFVGITVCALLINTAVIEWRRD